MRYLLALVLALPAAAWAQIVPENYTLLGAAIRTRPAYDGSKSQVDDIVPVVRYYGQPLFARTTQGILEGGLQWNIGSGVTAGFQVAYEEGRDASESAFLRNLSFNDDVDPGASIGAHIEWEGKAGPAPLLLLARYRQNMDSDRGAILDLRGSVGVYGANSVVVALFAEASWASSDELAAFYGVSAAQSAATGLPAYQPGSGFKHAAVGVIASYDFARHWSLVGSVQSRWLQGDASESPLAERSRNNYANAGIAYRF